MRRKTQTDCTTQYFVVPKINRTKKVCVFTYKNTKRFIFVKILCGFYIIAQTFGFCKSFKLIFARFLNDLNINKTYICGGDSKPFRANFQCIFKKSLWKPLDKTILRWYNNKALAETLSERELAGVAELADAQDLKSCGTIIPYRFDPGLRHQLNIAG